MTDDPDTPKPPPMPPLAEGRWLWRRIYVFSLSFGLWGLLAGSLALASPTALPGIAEGLVGLLALVLILYLVAPTTEQVVAILAQLRLRLKVGSEKGGGQ